jgi:hypothetical protein
MAMPLFLSDCWLIREWTQRLTTISRFDWQVRMAMQLLLSDCWLTRE